MTINEYGERVGSVYDGSYDHEDMKRPRIDTDGVFALSEDETNTNEVTASRMKEVHKDFAENIVVGFSRFLVEKARF